MNGHEKSSNERAMDPQPLYAVIAAYDVTTVRPERDVSLLFRDLAVSLGAELETLRIKQTGNEVALAAAEERTLSLRRQLETLRRVQLLAGSLSLLGAVLVGFGVNYLSSDKPSPGWVMLMLGGLMQLGSLATAFVDRDSGASD